MSDENAPNWKSRALGAEHEVARLEKLSAISDDTLRDYRSTVANQASIIADKDGIIASLQETISSQAQQVESLQQLVHTLERAQP